MKLTNGVACIRADLRACGLHTKVTEIVTACCYTSAPFQHWVINVARLGDVAGMQQANTDSCKQANTAVGLHGLAQRVRALCREQAGKQGELAHAGQSVKSIQAWGIGPLLTCSQYALALGE